MPQASDLGKRWMHGGLEILVTASSVDAAWMTEHGVQRVVDIALPNESSQDVIALVGDDTQPRSSVGCRLAGS